MAGFTLKKTSHLRRFHTYCFKKEFREWQKQKEVPAEAEIFASVLMADGRDDILLELTLGLEKQIQRSIYGKTQKDVRERLRQITVDLDTGAYQEPCSMKLGEWLDIWHSEYLNNVKPHTHASYAQTIRNHIKPALGSVRLDALTPVMMQKFINDLTKPKDDGSLLSAKTIKNIHGVVHRALNQAVRIGYLRTNPADYCIIPKVVQKQIHPLEETQIQTFLKAIQGREEEFLFITALFTGMRQSELLGLQWQDIDFHTNSIFISRQSTKIKGKW